VESEPECGTQVTIYLPQIIEEKQQEQRPDVHHDQQAPEPLAAREATILLVEDEVEVRRLAGVVLSTARPYHARSSRRT
jgi:hypothetical protein